MGIVQSKKGEIAEDVCFVYKDRGFLRVYDPGLINSLVFWKKKCKPKGQGGLRVIRLKEFNETMSRGSCGVSDENGECLESIGGEPAIYVHHGCVHTQRNQSGKQSMRALNNKSKKVKRFNGWASEELKNFLLSIGKDITVPLNHEDVATVVKEYISTKNLFKPNTKRKRHVIPDDKLYPLFRRKMIKYHKIFESLRIHLEREQLEVINNFPLSSEEDGEISRPEPIKTMKVVEQPKNLYAAIDMNNIRLAYLKKTLVLRLLEKIEATSGTFEEKVVGCFVKVKNDPKECPYLVQKIYQIGQITGIKKTEPAYKVEDRSIDCVLRVSNICKDVRISMLADNDLKEEEIDDLRELAKKGLFKPPLLQKFEKKVKGMHVDIERHAIEKELKSLRWRIVRANEKGWRRELFEHLDREELLKTEEEQTRRVNTIPAITPYKGDTEANMAELSNFHVDKKESHEAEKTEESPKQTSAVEEIEIIDLTEEDDDDNTAERKVAERFMRFTEVIWCYKDASSTVRGPFALCLLWRGQMWGDFDAGFKVWKLGQNEEEAILLDDAVCALFVRL